MILSTCFLTVENKCLLSVKEKYAYTFSLRKRAKSRKNIRRFLLFKRVSFFCAICFQFLLVFMDFFKFLLIFKCFLQNFSDFSGILGSFMSFYGFFRFLLVFRITFLCECFRHFNKFYVIIRITQS